MNLFIVGIVVLCCLTANAYVRNEPRVWNPLIIGPKLPRSPETIELEDFEEKATLEAEGLKNWYLHDTQHYYEEGRENSLPTTPHNFYFYLVQNFFFGKPINELTPPSSDAQNSENDDVVIPCQVQADCKDRNYRCEEGVCKFHQPQPYKCQIDLDCKNRAPKFAQTYLSVYCDSLGHCKYGRKPKTPKTPVVQMCRHHLECINGGECQNNRCVLPESPRNPLIPQKPVATCFKHEDCKNLNQRCYNGICMSLRQCKVDQDCRIQLPKGALSTIPVHCHQGHCKYGPREVNAAPEYQFCLQNSDCIDAGECLNHRCTPIPPAVIVQPFQRVPKGCRNNEDCKNFNQLCRGGICKPRFTLPCTADHECRNSQAVGLFAFLPMHCNKGFCAFGYPETQVPATTETTETPIYQSCKRSSDCSNKGKCRKNRCEINLDTIQTVQCKLNRDCVQKGDIFEDVIYCKKGYCKIRKQYKSLIKKVQLCVDNSECVDKSKKCYSNQCRRFRPFVYPPVRESKPNDLPYSTQTPINLLKCKIDDDCEGFGGRPLPEGVTNVTYFCLVGRCVTTAIVPQSCFKTSDCPSDRQCLNGQCLPFAVVPTLPSPNQECQSNSDCYQQDVVCGGGRSCQEGQCKSPIFSISLEILIPATRKPCIDDSGCFGHSIICGVPHRCEDSQCVSIHATTPSTTEVSEASSDPESFITFPPLTTPRKLSHCNVDEDCKRLFPHLKSHHCVEGICKYRRPCQQDSDCQRRILIPFLRGPYYCNNGYCKKGERPITIAPTFEPTPAPTLAPLPIKPKKCHSDRDCAYLHIYKPRYCDNGVCKRGLRPTPSAPKTPAPKPRPTLIPRTCQNDEDCVYRGNYRILIHEYCDNGICKRRRPRTTIQTTTSTQQPPITDVTLPETTEKPKYCQKDQDCLKYLEFQHKMLISVVCYEGQCIISKSANKRTTTLAPVLSSENPTTAQPPVIVTSRPFVPLRCKHDSDCQKKFPRIILGYPKVLKCFHGRCAVRTFHPKNTTTPAPTVQPEQPTENPETTVNPTENSPTKLPSFLYGCTDDSDCSKLPILGFPNVLQCVQGKCIFKLPLQPEDTTSSTVNSEPTTPAPALETTGPVTVEDQPTTTISKSTTRNPLGPVGPEVSPTPHVYTCRRNRDCKDYPHPAKMPVYCEHRLCKHGHRRPRNDFDSCKSNQDCQNGEGPCVDGFCTRPRHH